MKAGAQSSPGLTSEDHTAHCDKHGCQMVHVGMCKMPQNGCLCARAPLSVCSLFKKNLPLAFNRSFKNLSTAHDWDINCTRAKSQSSTAAVVVLIPTAPPHSCICYLLNAGKSLPPAAHHVCFRGLFLWGRLEDGLVCFPRGLGLIPSSAQRMERPPAALPGRVHLMPPMAPVAFGTRGDELPWEERACPVLAGQQQHWLGPRGQ